MSTVTIISFMVSGALNISAELQNQLVSVERILDYTNVGPECSGGAKSVGGWPFQGGIQFHAARVSYIPGKDVLHGITCTFHPCEKVNMSWRFTVVIIFQKY